MISICDRFFNYRLCVLFQKKEQLRVVLINMLIKCSGCRDANSTEINSRKSAKSQHVGGLIIFGGTSQQGLPLPLHPAPSTTRSTAVQAYQHSAPSANRHSCSDPSWAVTSRRNDDVGSRPLAAVAGVVSDLASPSSSPPTWSHPAPGFTTRRRVADISRLRSACLCC